ncbi:DEAD/DEAH box helicase [Oleiharenicola lentus]|uniref:DEAD/DEAH box helicase n=1 Tax=Oleiharenicola lentus TaxID=2508720 RepID=UPI003F67AAAE
MSYKSRQPTIRSVKTPQALFALRAWMAALDSAVRERGRRIIDAGQVTALRGTADHFFEAEITAEEKYLVKLFLTRGRWTSSCDCHRRVNCEHAYAAGAAWQSEVEKEEGSAKSAGTTESKSDAPAVATPAAPSVPEKISFRAKWAPVLAEKLGRQLTREEGQQLERLAELFAEFTQAHRVLYPGVLLRHGFEHSQPPGTPLYTPAFRGWWDDHTAPNDPWELWQYIAHDYSENDRLIPEVFEPKTDLDAIRVKIESHLLSHDLATWSRALASTEDLTDKPRTHPATAEIAALRARIHPEGSIVIEARPSPAKAWRSPPQKWYAALATARPIDFDYLTPPESALAAALAAETRAGLLAPAVRQPLAAEATANIFRTKAARDAIVLPDGNPFSIETEPLVLEAKPSRGSAERLDLHLVTPDGQNATHATLITLRPSPLYYFDNRVWSGPPPIPTTPLPTAALVDTRLMSRLRTLGLRLPKALEKDFRRVALRPVLKCWLAPSPDDEDESTFHAQLVARADDFPYEQEYRKNGWQWTSRGTPPNRKPGDPFLEFDFSAAQAASTRLPDFYLTWQDWAGDWTRSVGDEFPEEFIDWNESLPPGLKVEASPGLANLLGPPLQAHVEFSATPTGGAGARDWFNLTVKLRVGDTELTQDEIALLLKARGKWVNLGKHGWRRLDVAQTNPHDPALAALHRLGLDAIDVLEDGKPVTHRIHALQLAAEADLLEARDAALAHSLRERVSSIKALPAPALPEGLRATLRPYQQEGFHFLTHLSTLGLGGILADDMGLGKTVQTLAWLLNLAHAPRTDGKTFRALVVCPKSVTHGWLAESARFTPSLTAVSFNPMRTGAESEVASAAIVVTNYSQLRINASWFKSQHWDAVVLDEGQFIKNPGSQVAITARSLLSKHRLVLTGTPIENRLTDLWSLFAFAQPGLLGTQASFKRQHDQVDAAALTRLHRRVRHFLLRRTKAEAAPDLPSRTEDDLIVELEGEQRALYDAELKRARAQLLGVQTSAQLASVRFNVLASLLRLRQICCHPALVDPAHRDLPSAKLDALMERLEELQEEGHQVLVFSQFVGMLEIIRDRLIKARIDYLILTGATENRAELVNTFQTDKTKTVFLLSLKAAGFGLNLTAASYAILYDPWWNPAAEAQAIDRTHRIGQTQPVVAYRLLAEGTVEEKIRSLQKEKAALAAAVVQEESLAQVLDLDSLRKILE